MPHTPFHQNMASSSQRHTFYVAAPYLSRATTLTLFFDKDLGVASPDHKRTMHGSIYIRQHRHLLFRSYPPGTSLLSLESILAYAINNGSSNVCSFSPALTTSYIYRKKTNWKTLGGLRKLRAPQVYAAYYGDSNSRELKRFKLNVKVLILNH